MPWVRVDVGVPNCSDMAEIRNKYPRDYGNCLGLWLAALCYSQQNLTDGFLFDAIWRSLLASEKAAKRSGKRLVEVGLWVVEKDGIRIKNYEIYNLTKKDIMAKRRENTKKNRKWREERRKKRDHGYDSVSDSVSDASMTVPHTHTHTQLQFKEGGEFPSRVCVRAREKNPTPTKNESFESNQDVEIKPADVWQIWEEQAGRPCGDMTYHLTHLKSILNSCEATGGDTIETVRDVVKAHWDERKKLGKTSKPEWLAENIVKYFPGPEPPHEPRGYMNYEQTVQWERGLESEKRKPENLKPFEPSKTVLEEYYKMADEKQNGGS